MERLVEAERAGGADQAGGQVEGEVAVGVSGEVVGAEADDPTRRLAEQSAADAAAVGAGGDEVGQHVAGGDAVAERQLDDEAVIDDGRLADGADEQRVRPEAGHAGLGQCGPGAGAEQVGGERERDRRGAGQADGGQERQRPRRLPRPPAGDRRDRPAGRLGVGVGGDHVGVEVPADGGRGGDDIAVAGVDRRDVQHAAVDGGEGAVPHHPRRHVGERRRRRRRSRTAGWGGARRGRSTCQSSLTERAIHGGLYGTAGNLTRTTRGAIVTRSHWGAPVTAADRWQPASRLRVGTGADRRSF